MKFVLATLMVLLIGSSTAVAKISKCELFLNKVMQTKRTRLKKNLINEIKLTAELVQSEDDVLLLYRALVDANLPDDAILAVSEKINFLPPALRQLFSKF